MSKITRRQMIGAAVAGATVGAAKARAAPDKEKLVSFEERFLPAKLTKEEIEAANGAWFTKQTFAGSAFYVGISSFSDGVPHTTIGIYAPDKAGVFHRCLLTVSWAAGNIKAAVDAKTGLLELREEANSELKGEIVLACNLRTIGTQYSIETK